MPPFVRTFTNNCAAFMRRDLLSDSSYKLQSLFRILTVVFQLFQFYFLSLLINHGTPSVHLERFGGDYFTFALVGIAFQGLFSAGLIDFTASIRHQMSVGVFEAMAVAPVRTTSVLAYSLLWPLGLELLKGFFYLALGATFFGAQLTFSRLPLLLLALLLCFFVFGSLGIIAASMVLYFKKGDPVAWFVSTGSALFGGVFFPVSILPSWLSPLSVVLPITYALETLRACLIPTASSSGLYENLLILALFAVVLVPVSFYAADALIKKALVAGSLGQY